MTVTVIHRKTVPCAVESLAEQASHSPSEVLDQEMQGVFEF